jgi:hypothetical protein
VASGWVELFNGQDLTGWRARGSGSTWHVVGAVRLDPEDPRAFVSEPGTGVLVNSERGRTVDLYTELLHGDCELHLEYCVAERSNSGVYLMGQYEIQILDSWGEEPPLRYGTNGGIYARHRHPVTGRDYGGHPPRVNASRRPGEWQTLDVVFRAPRFDGQGYKVRDAQFVRVVLNGHLIHERVAVDLPTGGAWDPYDIPRGPLRLQGDHGPVAFRDIRMRLLGA